MEPIELNKLIKSRAHRILKNLDRYESINDQDVNTLMTRDFLLQENEELLGIYKNRDSNLTETIVVSTNGLHIFIAEWCFIEYVQING